MVAEVSHGVQPLRSIEENGVPGVSLDHDDESRRKKTNGTSWLQLTCTALRRLPDVVIPRARP